MTFRVVVGLQCPKCGACEMHPTQDLLLIHGFKVSDDDGWWSQCLVCSGGWSKDLSAFDESKHNGNKGWFVC